MNYLRNMVLPVMVFCAISESAKGELLRDPTQPESASLVATQPYQPGLSAVIVSTDRRLAVIDGKIVREGQMVNGNTIISIQENHVKLHGANGDTTLFLTNQKVIQNEQGNENAN